MQKKELHEKISGRTALILDVLLLIPMFFLYSSFIMLAMIGSGADEHVGNVAYICIALVWIIPCIGSISLYNTQRYGWSILVAALPLIPPIIAVTGFAVANIVAAN